MADGEDYVLRPVMLDKLRYESLLDGTVDIYDIAVLNEALDVMNENERRATEIKRG